MDMKTRMYFENRRKYAGKYFDLSGLKPASICVYTDSRYFMQQDAMAWSIGYVTDDPVAFNLMTLENWSGDKGLSRNLTCWELLQEIRWAEGTNSTHKSFVEIDYYHKPATCVYVQEVFPELLKLFTPKVAYMTEKNKST